MDRYAVFGFPISHSKSPFIHQQFAKQTGQQIRYEAEEVRPENFDAAVDVFFKEGGKGLNCTVPLKELAYEKVDLLTERAKFSGAVNTIKRQDDGSLLGDNTDGIGLLTDLRVNLGVDIEGKRVLVLGAGGASRGIIGPLLKEKPLAFYLANRTVAKAKAMEELFAPIGVVQAGSYESLHEHQFDIVLNATSASLTGQLPPLADQLLAEGALCYDLAYSQEPTAFMLWAQQQKARLIKDGLGMLVEQAAHAFYLWRGVMPNSQTVLARLKQKKQLTDKSG
ncbi:MAG: shikimate dehydrogenase [Cycloclasticus sp.]|nr:shikimate dehydrogenase [Cycloclasticus sp.]MBG96031.1 shikimate dehydrogenase [Cycloclasticus sp.]HAI96215.1 shikimate dehydrogenase [Methylococcaceae bacterium]|tara:strand:+ start:46 stop:885 length:840 start_codon:yes stop_codon:yes gene_type:complete